MTPITPPPEFYVGWGTLAFINAGLAQSKNRSRLNWFLATLILGPVAAALIVVLDPVDRPLGKN